MKFSVFETFDADFIAVRIADRASGGI